MSDFEKLINASDLIEWIIETDPDWCVGSVRCIIDHIDKMPSAQSTMGQVFDGDTINRQAAIEAHYEYCNKHPDAGFPVWSLKILEDLPSAQPELPEWAQKVEEYRKSAPSFVRNQLVWALYQTWKEYDGRLVHQRGKENR